MKRPALKNYFHTATVRPIPSKSGCPTNASERVTFQLRHPRILFLTSLLTLGGLTPSPGLSAGIPILAQENKGTMPSGQATPYPMGSHPAGVYMSASAETRSAPTEQSEFTVVGKRLTSLVAKIDLLQTV